MEEFSIQKEIEQSGVTGEAKFIFAYYLTKALKEGSSRTSAYYGAFHELKELGYKKDAEGVWRKSEPAFKDCEIKMKVNKIEATDEEQRLVFGFFSVVEVDGNPVVDLQGDVITSKDIENAAYKYMRFSRMGDDRHDERAKAVIVESMVFTKEKQKLLGIDLGFVGWWGGFKVLDDALWKNFKSGKYEGFSIGGRGRREPFNE